MSTRLCAFPDCGRRAVAQGHCHAHYKQKRRGTPLAPLQTKPSKPARFCAFPECGKPHKALGYCNGHYAQKKQEQSLRKLWRSHRPKGIDQASWFWTAVDKSGDCWEWTAGKDPNGYGSTHFDGRRQSTHRVAYQIAVGPIPEGMYIDHICHNKICANPEHLRLATAKTNAENRSLAGASDNTSGHRGVTYKKSSGMWIARVGHHGMRHHIGQYTTVEEASEAARSARARLFTHSQD